MKRFVLSIFILFFVSAIFRLPTSFALAQSFDFNRAYDDYIYTYDRYREASKEYQQAKEVYLSHQNAITKKEAVGKLRALLSLRNDVIVTYLTALRHKLSQITGILNYQQNIYYVRLDEEVAWFKAQAKELSQIEQLESLTSLDQEAQSHYKSTEALIYKTLVAILSGKENNFKTRIEEQADSLSSRLLEIKAEGFKDVSLSENWLSDSQERLSQSESEIASAWQVINKIDKEDSRAKSYGLAKDHLKQSHLFLTEALDLLNKAIFELTHD